MQPVPLCTVPQELLQPQNSTQGETWGPLGGVGLAQSPPQSVGCPAFSQWAPGGGREAAPDSVCALSTQRLKDEIAEVTNEIENLGSTEER